MFGKSKKIYEPRVRGEMLNLKLLGPECSAPPGLALLKRRRQLAESELATVSAWTYFILSIAQMVLTVVLFWCVYSNRISVLKGVIIMILVSLLQRYADCVFTTRACILVGNVQCCIARIKDYDEPYADIQFPNGYTGSDFFVYSGDGRQLKPGDAVYVCVIEYEDLQLCEVRPVSELGKASRKASSRKSRKKKKG